MTDNHELETELAEYKKEEAALNSFLLFLSWAKISLPEEHLETEGME